MTDRHDDETPRLLRFGLRPDPTSIRMPTLQAACLGCGSALFLGFLWSLLSSSLPAALGWHGIQDRLNPFDPAHARHLSTRLLSDPLFLTATVLSNAVIIGVPGLLVRLLHHGSRLGLTLLYFAFLLAINLLLQKGNLSSSFPLDHRIAYLLDLGIGLGAAALGTSLGDPVRRMVEYRAS
jgi:hypothetical protein